MKDSLRIIQDLTQEIGPRPPTSAAEAQAAAYVNAEMRNASLDVEIQSFRALPTSSLPYGIIFALFTVTPLLYFYLPPAALGVSLFALIAFVSEALSYPFLSALFPLGKSQNIIGTRPAARESRQHLIVMAHMDTARAGLFFHPRLSKGFRRAFQVMVGVAVALPLLTGLGWWFQHPGFWYAQWPLAGYAGIVLLLLIHQEIFSPFAAGANDNASGLATLIQLAHELEDLQHTDLWLVATGCEESGLYGARLFLRQYPFPWQNTYILNLDHVGRGQLSIIVKEGMLWAQDADPLLVEFAGQAEAGEISIDADPRTYHLINTDGLAAMRRNYRSMSIMALEGRHPSDWHWTTDTIERIQPDVIERAVRLVRRLARRLDGYAAEPSSPIVTTDFFSMQQIETSEEG
jgi:hypothetical protein